MTYSGLISLAIGLTTIVTGMVFTLIVTRTLTPTEFGTWNLIGGLIIYVVVAEPVISYWATREIARGEDSGRTAVISSGVFSVGATVAYIIIAYFVSFSVNADRGILLFSAILVPVMFLNRTLTAVNLGWKPQATSYGTLCFEITKIPIGLVLVYFLHTGIYGAILTTFICYIASNIVLAIYARDKIVQRFKIIYLKKWFKLSWLSVYPGIYNIVFHLDVIIFSTLSGSLVGLAFYSAAQTIANAMANSSQISQAVYPKLLAGGAKSHLEENIVRFFYFAFPLTALSIVFAKPALFLLKPMYDIAVPVVIFMTIRTFFYTIGGIYSQSLLGIEKVDINEKSTFKDYVKSKLFLMPTLNLIQNITYVITLALGLVFLTPQNTTLIDKVIYWSIISLVTQVPFTCYFYLSARKHLKLETDIRPILKYLLISIVSFGITYALVERFLNYTKTIFVFLPDTFLFVAIGIGMYLGMTYVADLKTRVLFNAIFSELKGTKS